MPAEPRPAATVVVLRPSAPRFDVLLLRRSDELAFLPGAYVFPGGRVEDTDLGASLDQRYRAAAARELREEAGVMVETAHLLPIAQWITPPTEAKRFDTRFFLTVVPTETEATLGPGEHTDLLWIDPGVALDRAARGDLVLPPPTWVTLRDLAAFQHHQDAFVSAFACTLERLEPYVEERGGITRLIVPRQPPLRFVRERGRWVAADA